MYSAAEIHESAPDYKQKSRASHVRDCALFRHNTSSVTSTENMMASLPGKKKAQRCTCKALLSDNDAIDSANHWSTGYRKPTTYSMTKPRRLLTPFERSQKQTASTSQQKQQMTRSRCATANSSTSAVLLARRRIIRLLVAVVTSFAICVLPYHAMKLWLIFGLQPASHTTEILHTTAFLFYYLNNALNPMLYAFLSKNFSRSLHELCYVPDRPACQQKRHRNNSVVRAHVTNSTL